MMTLHGPINTDPWQEEHSGGSLTVNLSLTDEPEDARRWITVGTGTTQRDLGAPLRRTPVRSSWPNLGPASPVDPVKRVSPSRRTQGTLDALRKREPLLWGRAGSSISFRSDRLREEAEHRRSQRGKRIVKVEREHTRHGSHPGSLDRIFGDLEWTEPEPRTSPLLTGTRETARRVRAQFGHLGGKSKMDSPRNVESPDLRRLIVGRRAGKS